MRCRRSGERVGQRTSTDEDGVKHTACEANKDGRRVGAKERGAAKRTGNFFFLPSHRSPETRINLSTDLYDISQQKVNHFKPVDLFLFYTKTMFPIWGDAVQ